MHRRAQPKRRGGRLQKAVRNPRIRPQRRAETESEESEGPEEPKQQVELEPVLTLHERMRALIEARGHTTNSYDDRICKRLKIGTKSSSSWLEGRANGGIKKPAYYSPMNNPLFAAAGDHTLYTAAYIASMSRSNNTQNPIKAMGDFAKLPVEVRDNIFRNLLVHNRDIRVFGKWAIVFPRLRPNLEANLLQVCQVFYQEGIRILYGENTFLYLIRDPFEERQETTRIDRDVYDQNRVPIDKHGHLIRNIRIVVEPNRLQHFESRKNLPKAIEKFLPSHGLAVPAQLHSITIEIPAMTRRDLRLRDGNKNDVPVADFFRNGASVHKALKKLNCQFIYIIAHDKRGRHYKSVIDRRPYFSRLEAKVGGDDPWSADVVMQAARKQAAKRSKARLGDIWHFILLLAKDPNKVTLQKNPVFKEFVPEAPPPEPLQMLPTIYPSPRARPSSKAQKRDPPRLRSPEARLMHLKQQDQLQAGTSGTCVLDAEFLEDSESSTPALSTSPSISSGTASPDSFLN